MVVHTCNPSTWDPDAGGAETQAYPSVSAGHVKGRWSGGRGSSVDGEHLPYWLALAAALDAAAAAGVPAPKWIKST